MQTNETNEAKRNSVLMIVILLCTITIIWTNYIFIEKLLSDLKENEYKKIWWKENYLIMQELQKREIVWYINKIKEEKPELIEEILNKKDDFKVLNENIIKDLKKDTSISWNSGATVSIIEFSDLECPYCITNHNSWINKKILEKNKDKVNYIFKNFPLPNHANSKIEAEAAKCVENISWWDKYMEYIDNIFNTTVWGWEWFKIEELYVLAEKLEINKEEFKNCLDNRKLKEQVEREFQQWVMLWINSVPSTLIINNESWKYKIISESIKLEDLELIINDISK